MFFDPLLVPVELEVEVDVAVEVLAFFLSEVLPNSLTTISILMVSMAPISDKFEPQVSNEDTLPFPGAEIRKVQLIS